MARKEKDSNARPQDTKIQGEGDYEAARRYNDKTREHVQSGGLDEAGSDAQPASRAEQKELERAEEEGRERAKEEDRLLEHPERISKEGK